MSVAMSNPARAHSLTISGITALHSGDKPEACRLLNEAVRLDPASEEAWLWLSGAVETSEERLRCLERVLAINPESAAAKHGLKMLGAVPVAAAAPAATAAPSIAATLVAEPASPATAPSSTSYADWVFGRDTFLLRQKVALNEKYQVWDEHQQALLYIERPRYVMRAFLAVSGTLLVSAVMVVLGLLAASKLPDGLVQGLFLLVYMLGCFVLAIALMVTLSKKRHVTFYRDETKQEQMLQIQQDSKFYLINATFTVNDAHGQRLATLRKNHLYNLLRKRWYCYAPDGSLMILAKEDSMLRSILRRTCSQLGALGTLLLPLLRTNFVFLRGEQPVGIFNRKLTLLDRYVLDLRRDPSRSLDRRVALALGVMLDTAERR